MKEIYLFLAPAMKVAIIINYMRILVIYDIYIEGDFSESDLELPVKPRLKSSTTSG